MAVAAVGGLVGSVKTQASMPIQLQEARGMSAQNKWRNPPMGLEKMRSDSIPTAAARCFSSI